MIVIVHENMHERLHAYQGLVLPPRPLCMGVLCAKWLHITLQGLLLLATLPTPGIKLESADNPSNVVHTTPSTLRTFVVRN